MGVAKRRSMLWFPQNRLNSIGHISKTILNWLKQLDKLHTHISCTLVPNISQFGDPGLKTKIFFGDLIWNDPL